ncbi:MAG: hypothetical protein PHF37_00495 [Phycisphaerae bacterium]|nr:hypothetical protein [Phycisphaerae bacterium]
MNQINFEREFDERLDAVLDSKLSAIFGDAYATLKAMPTADAQDGETVYVDTANGVLKVSSGGV